MKSLLKKELGYYFNNPIGYIVAVLFAAFANILFVKDMFLRGDSSMRAFFDILTWLLIIFIPAISMRIFAEEKRTNTLETLLTLPLLESSLVLSKFLALLIFSSISLSLTLSIPVALLFLGKPPIAEIAISYLGTIFLIASFLSISMFFSSLTKNQIVAFLTGTVALFVLYLIGTEFFSTYIPLFVHSSLIYFSPQYHYKQFLEGVIDLRSVVYFISLSLLFLFLTIINLEKRD